MAQMPYMRLRIWQEADEFAFSVDQLVQSTRIANTRFLRDQLTRSAYSAPANIAEGRGRGTRADYAAFLDRARGSLHEAHYWLHAAFRRGDITEEQHRSHSEWAERISVAIWNARNRLREADGRPVPPPFARDRSPAP
jgi:four helix bundle protein